MERLRDLRRVHKKAWFGVWILVLVAVLTGAQWRFGGNNPIVARVLGAQAKKPDVTPPAVSISFPANNGVYGPSTWAGVVRGSASDATGVNNVEVRLGNGAWVAASGTTSWSWPLSLPTAEGLYTVAARATDTASPAAITSNPVSATFRVDRTAPTTAPIFTKTPDDVTFETRAQFNYLHGEAPVTFECALDGATPMACAPSGIEYKNLSAGTHHFTVIAIDAAGNRSPAASWSWTVLLKKVFGISGSPIGPLYPDKTVPLDLRISNPYNFAMQVLTIDVTVKTSSADGCPVADNFEGPLTGRFTLSTPAVVPASSGAFLTDLRPSPEVWPADWPSITMKDTSANQDACKNATFTLSYSGTATKP